MRILLVSDLHYSLRQFDWLVAAAPEFDLVVIAGDHLDISSAVECEAQIVVVLKYIELISARVPVVVSSGNHDLTGADSNGEAAALWLTEARSSRVYIDGDAMMIGDTLITICPWWDGPAGQSAVASQLHADAFRRPRNWVWVYHWPPVDSPTSWTGRRYYGDAELASWIAEHRPDIVLAGHVHEPPFKSDGGWADRIGNTWVFNPGRQTGPIPTCIEIDLTAGTAAWFSMIGTEELSLADPVPPARTVA